MSDAYRAAGVDVAAADRLVATIGPKVTATWGDGVVGGFGGFAAGVRIPAGYQNPVLMLSTDGVGTKLEIARSVGRFDTVGQDLVAMCADDLAAVGARPIAFVDYIAVGSLDEQREAEVVEGVARACRLADCALVGGETAEHPGVMSSGQIDLAGTALGVADEDAVLHPGLVEDTDILIGVSSPNLRSNGFSLVRSIVGDRDLSMGFEGTSLADALLAPSVIYTPAAVSVATIPGVHGMAHITGGGLPGNVPRMLPDGLGGFVDRTTWTPPAIFEWLTHEGELDELDRFGALNMGIGFVVAATPEAVDEVVAEFARHGHPAWPIGKVEAGQNLRLG